MTLRNTHNQCEDERMKYYYLMSSDYSLQFISFQKMETCIVHVIISTETNLV